MTIRPHTIADEGRLIELLRLNTPAYFSPNEERDLLNYLRNHADNYYVLEVDGVIAGCGGFNIAEDGITAKISWDIFDPQHQGKGLGTALTTFRIRRIRSLGYIQVLSVRTSQMAFQFYERFGLRIREVVKDFWDKGFDLYRLDNSIELVAEEPLRGTTTAHD